MADNGLRNDLVERSIIGLLVNGQSNPDTFLEHLTDEDFARLDTRSVFLAIRKMYLEGQVRFNEISVSQRLREMGLYDQAGGTAALYSFQADIPKCADINECISILKECTARRKLYEIGRNLQDSASTSKVNLSDMIGSAEQDLLKVSQGQLSSSQSIGEIMQESLSQIMQIYSGERPEGSLLTGFRGLDKMLYSINPTDFVVIGARPSMGKTAMALNIMSNIASQGYPVAFYSLEMTRQSLGMRMILGKAGISADKIKNGDLEESDIRSLGEAAGILSETPMYIQDSSPMDMMKLIASARKLKAERDIKLIIIDYLQLLTGNRGKNDNRQQEVSDISRSLKLLAKELNIPVIALCQLNRGVESREDKRPKMSDLRESGSLEQDADIIMFLYRDDYYNPDSEDKDITEMIVAKHRNGRVGTVRMFFNKDTTTFYDLTPEDPIKQIEMPIEDPPPPPESPEPDEPPTEMP